MKIEKSDYHAFLLRLWRENGRSPWRASLDNPHTGEKETFSSIEQLWAHVQAQIDPSITVLTQETVSTIELENE